jgi:hypothetical protein
VQFDYKASKAAKASTEYHAAPQSYLYWNAIGNVNFTTEWKTFNGEFTVPNDADGMKSIAFDLQHEKSATDYYFDNFSVSYKKSEWTNIIVNSDMEGTDVSCFYVKENAMGSDNIYLAHITDGIGKDDSRAIRVRSTGTEENTYDTQFFIRLPYELPASTMYRLSFDYEAGKNAKSAFQCANEPKEYIIWYIGENDTEDFSFTTEWQHYKKVYNVPSVCNGEKHSDADWLDNFQTIYFSLAVDGEATEYIIDNVKVEILNSVLSTLTPSPVTDPKLMIAYPPYTVSLAEGTVDADKWTITPAEGAYEGETVTATYSGSKKVLGVKAEAKKGGSAVLAPALENGATVVIICNWGGATTTFTYTNNGGTFSGQASGYEAGYFNNGLELNGKNLSFSAWNVDNSEFLSVGITFNTESSAYSYTGKGEDFSSFTISVNGTDVTDQLSELK